jgi:hypothetical protein
MSYALAARLAKLEALAQPQTTGSDVRAFLRPGPAEAPDHVRPLLTRWRCTIAAMTADAHDDPDLALAELLADGFVLDREMIAAVTARVDAIRLAVLQAGADVTNPDQEERHRQVNEPNVELAF